MQALQHYLAVYGYAALLPLAIIEGPAVTVFAGVLAAQGILDAAIVYGVVVAGDLIGDVLYYAAGRWALRLLRHRNWRWAQRLRHRVAEMAPRIRAHAGKMLVIGKLTHSAGFAALLAAGAVHVTLHRFFVFNLLGTLPKSLVLLLIGYCFGRLYMSVQGDLGIAGAVAFVVVATGLFVLARRLFDPHKQAGV